MALIRKAEKTEIQRLRKNYLAKRRRLIKKGVPENIIPSFPLISPAMPRLQVNEIKRQMRSFASSPKYQYKQVNDNLWLTKQQLSDLKRAQKRANEIAMKAYRRNLKKPFIPLSERSWAHPGAHRTVESEHMKKPPKGYRKTPESFSSVKELENYIQHLKNYIKKGISYYDELYRANTIQAIENLFGETAAAPLVARIKSLKIDEFIFLMETQDIELEYLYVDDGTEMDDRLEMIAQYFDDEALARYYKK